MRHLAARAWSARWWVVPHNGLTVMPDLCLNHFLLVLEQHRGPGWAGLKVPATRDGEWMGDTMYKEVGAGCQDIATCLAASLLVCAQRSWYVGACSTRFRAMPGAPGASVALHSAYAANRHRDSNNDGTPVIHGTGNFTRGTRINFGTGTKFKAMASQPTAMGRKDQTTTRKHHQTQTPEGRPGRSGPAERQGLRGALPAASRITGGPNL